MKISIWHNNSDIRIEEAPTPKPGPREMLVKVSACGICGSDLVEWYRLPRAPLVQGHELTGVVAETGYGVKDFKPGDRVCVAPKVPCMRCPYCLNGHYPVCPNVKERLPGGFAEYVLVPETLIELGAFKLPPQLSFEQGTFIEPLACAVRAQNLAPVQKGQTVLILGCGMSGLLHVQLAKSRGAKVIASDINEKRLKLAQRFGAEALEPGTGKADTVLLCTAALPAIDQAWNSVDKGGTIIFFAVPDPGKKVTIPINDYWTKEIRIQTSYYCGPYDLKDALNLLETGTIEVDEMITHRFPLDKIAEGFRLVQDGRDSLKVIINP